MSVTFNDHSDEVLEAFDKACLRALERCGLQAEGYAKDLVPVDTGNLRNSISHKVDSSEPAAYIGTNVEYAPYIELGAQGRKGLHFLQKAATQHGDEYKRLMEDSMKNA